MREGGVCATNEEQELDVAGIKRGDEPGKLSFGEWSVGWVAGQQEVVKEDAGDQEGEADGKIVVE